MNARIDASPAAAAAIGATPATPRDNKMAAALRTFTSSTSGYGSLFADSPTDEAQAFSAEKRSTLMVRRSGMNFQFYSKNKKKVFAAK